MRSALWLFALSLSAQAQTVDCPDRYPIQEINITDQVPYGHNNTGRGIVGKGQLLIGATIYIGDPKVDGGELIGSKPKKIKGGWETAYPFNPNEPKWLVCLYGKSGAVRWVEPMNAKATECRVREMKQGMVVTATASCR